MKNMQYKYPNKLKELRIKRNLKQKEVAALLGFKSDDRICRWEKGQALPSLYNIIKLSQLFNVKVEELYLKMEQAKKS